jgi:hypothetical protein
MAKKAAPRHVEPEDESQDIEQQEAIEAREPEPAGEAISKSEAARRAIAAGLDSPEEATDFIRKRFGIEMSKPHFSAVKSQMKKKEGGAKPKRGRKSKTWQSQPDAPPIEHYFTPSPKTGDSSDDLLEAMEAMKPLVASLGAEKVKRIVDLLG